MVKRWLYQAFGAVATVEGLGIMPERVKRIQKCLLNLRRA
jgi:hypothetical protein